MTQISSGENWKDVVIHHCSELLACDLLALGLVRLMAGLCHQHDRLHPLHLRVAGIFLGAQLIRIRARAKERLQKSAGLQNMQLKRVQDWINDHIFERIGIEALARVAGIIRSHFGRLFTASTGYPPRRYILIQRVHRALELVQRGGMRMSEIAALVGFADQSHLSRSLRKFYGCLLSKKKHQ